MSVIHKVLVGPKDKKQFVSNSKNTNVCYRYKIIKSLYFPLDLVTDTYSRDVYFTSSKFIQAMGNDSKEKNVVKKTETTSCLSFNQN